MESIVIKILSAFHKIATLQKMVDIIANHIKHSLEDIIRFKVQSIGRMSY